jgi:threonylcarbamoyladenosine tRNA methylthiotransferase MtaB
VTLGCKVNQYETQYVKELLEASGFREATTDERADLCVVNTCTVTHEADAKGRQLIRRLALANPSADIVVMGCYATRAPEAVSRLPGVSCVITDKATIATALASYGVVGGRPGIRRFDGHRRAFVKVQDGCFLNCSFCIIPQVRPVVRSRPIAEIVEEVNGLVAAGCQEIVLTGIHLGHYGIDLSRGKPRDQWQRLWHLIRRLDELRGDFRLRLSSLEAAEARGELVEALATSRRVCPHLHLCLQSGSDRILKLMKRRYRVAGYLERCRRLKEVFHKPALTTDIIIGFPGETEEDFAGTCSVVEEVGFCKLHLFSFSPRSGTQAARMPDQIPPEVKAERRDRLLALESKLARKYWHDLLGEELDVLIEGPDRDRSGQLLGTSCRYVAVSLPGYLPALLGKRVPVIAKQVGSQHLIAEPVERSELISQKGVATNRSSNRHRIALPQVAVVLS